MWASPGQDFIDLFFKPAVFFFFFFFRHGAYRLAHAGRWVHTLETKASGFFEAGGRGQPGAKSQVGRALGAGEWVCAGCARRGGSAESGGAASAAEEEDEEEEEVVAASPRGRAAPEARSGGRSELPWTGTSHGAQGARTESCGAG